MSEFRKASDAEFEKINKGHKAAEVNIQRVLEQQSNSDLVKLMGYSCELSREAHTEGDHTLSFTFALANSRLRQTLMQRLEAER